MLYILSNVLKGLAGILIEDPYIMPLVIRKLFGIMMMCLALSRRAGSKHRLLREVVNAWYAWYAKQ